jgi:hypothetical protein
MTNRTDAPQTNPMVGSPSQRPPRRRIAPRRRRQARMRLPRLLHPACQSITETAEPEDLSLVSSLSPARSSRPSWPPFVATMTPRGLWPATMSTRPPIPGRASRSRCSKRSTTSPTTTNPIATGLTTMNPPWRARVVFLAMLDPTIWNRFHMIGTGPNRISTRVTRRRDRRPLIGQRRACWTSLARSWRVCSAAPGRNPTTPASRRCQTHRMWSHAHLRTTRPTSNRGEHRTSPSRRRKRLQPAVRPRVRSAGRRWWNHRATRRLRTWPTCRLAFGYRSLITVPAWSRALSLACRSHHRTDLLRQRRLLKLPRQLGHRMTAQRGLGVRRERRSRRREERLRR